MEKVACVIDGFEEIRQVGYVTSDTGGTYTSSAPIAMSERAFLFIRLPNDRTVKVEVPHVDFVSKVFPLLAGNATSEQGVTP